jgi:AcrR family transcriptional regulator
LSRASADETIGLVTDAAKTTRDRSADVKQAIRASATHLFATQGFAATGVREIAVRAGGGSGTRHPSFRF